MKKSSPSEGFELLNKHSSLLAKIFSYIIEDTKGLAKLRLVSKEWNADVRPKVLCDFGFRKVCYPTKHNYCRELVQIDDSSYAGRYYEPSSFDFKFFVSPKDLAKREKIDFNDEEQDLGRDNRKPKASWATTEGILFCRDDEDWDWTRKRKIRIEKAESYDFSKDDSGRFALYCERISSTKSIDDFKTLVDDAIADGLFLCLEDLTNFRRNGEAIEIFQDENQEGLPRPLIVNLRLPKKHGLEVIEVDGSKIVFLKVGIDMDSDDMTDAEHAFPFVEDPFLEDFYIPCDSSAIYPTFVGYNVKEYENGGLTCQVPMVVLWNEGLEDQLWSWGSGGSFLPLDALWSKCQEQHVREGVAIADAFVPRALQESLMKQIDELVKTQIVDYHPHSNNVVRDIVHPALYSYVKGVSPMLKTEEEIQALSSRPPIHKEDYAIIFDHVHRDYWGRKYEASAKYQWLPTYFDIAVDGSCTICDYINNLVPRSEHEALYESLAQLFSQALPLIESVYGYCRVVTEEEDEEAGFGFLKKSPLPPIQENPASLRGKQVQVVTKIVDYELGPGQTYEGVWHVEGMSHEEIVATAIYFIDRDDEIEGGDILFKRAFSSDEFFFIASSVDQIRPPQLEEKIEEGLLPLGQVKTLPGRLLVFPNSHIHKVTELKNTSTEKDSIMKKRRIIAFFLINPERRIVSTKEVPVQQEHAGGTMKRCDALDHRLKLMAERKYTKQDWNVREIELCEH